MIMLLHSETLFLFLANNGAALTTTGGLGVLTTYSGLPEVSETSVESHLLHSLEVLTQSTVQQVSVLVRGLAVLDVLGSVQEPQGDLELLGVGDDRDDLSDLLLGQLTSALFHVDIALLADDVRESSSDTLRIAR